MKLMKKIERWYLELVSKVTGDEYVVDKQVDEESVHINLQEKIKNQK